MTANHIHIFYTDAASGWCLQVRDAIGNELDTAYHYRKADAQAHAKAFGLPVHVFGRDHHYQRTIA